jgi:hypothetical protein
MSPSALSFWTTSWAMTGTLPLKRRIGAAP